MFWVRPVAERSKDKRRYVYKKIVEADTKEVATKKFQQLGNSLPNKQTFFGEVFGPFVTKKDAKELSPKFGYMHEV